MQSIIVQKNNNNLSALIISIFLIISSVVFLFTPFPYIALFVPIGLIFILYSNKKAGFLYYLLLFSIPFYKYRTLSTTYPFLKIDYILGFILIFFIIREIFFSKSLPISLKNTKKLWKILLLFLLVNIISVLFSPYKEQAILNFFNPLLVSYVYIFLNIFLLTDEGYKKYVPFIICLAVAIAGAIGIFAYIFHIESLLSPTPQGMRAEGVTSNANNMSFMVVFVFPIIVHFLLEEKKFFIKLLYFIMLICCIGGLITSFSRGGFLNITLMCFLIFLEKKYIITPKNFGIVLAILGIIFSLFLIFIPQSYIDRVLTIKQGVDADISTQRRAAYLKAGFKSFVKHPIIGTGPFTFRQIWLNSEEIKNFPYVARPAHNTYMDILTGSGLLGLIFFIAIIMYNYKCFVKAQKIAIVNKDYKLASLISSYKLAFMGSCAYFFIMSAFEHKFFLLAIALAQFSLKITQQKNLA